MFNNTVIDFKFEFMCDSAGVVQTSAPSIPLPTKRKHRKKNNNIKSANHIASGSSGSGFCESIPCTNDLDKG